VLGSAGTHATVGGQIVHVAFREMTIFPRIYAGATRCLFSRDRVRLLYDFPPFLILARFIVRVIIPLHRLTLKCGNVYVAKLTDSMLVLILN